MDLFSKFKKDYFNYLISIILPALISGLSIPVFKNLLGAKGYGKFSIWLNAILILTAVLSGWITQSIIRLFPASANKHSFSRGAIVLSIQTQLIFFLPVFIISWYISHDVILATLCSLILITTCLQFTILPVIQSSFLSKKIITSETIRIFSYVGLAVLLLKLTGLSYLYSLFIAVIVSYSLSLAYLIRQAIIFFREIDTPEKNESAHNLFKSFFKYGAPLSLWFIFSYLFTYIDKLFMFKYMGAEAQGNYQAIFDLLYKSIALIISPVITSLFPILTSAYEKEDKADIRKFLKKIIIYELGGFAAVSILYWWFGADLLLFVLKTPNTYSFRLMGFIVICGTFIWQLAILAQKRFELQFKTFYLLVMAAITFFIQVIFYLLFKDYHNNQLLYPLGFLLSSFIYLLLISFTELLSFSKKIRLKRKILK